MAHFGVQKAKKMLALAGVATVASAGLLSVNNASAISELDRATDYDCSTADSRDVYLKTANAIKWAVKNQKKFYEPSSVNCYVDWGSASPIEHDVKFYISGGEYTFDELVKRDENSNNSEIIISDGADVVFKGTSDSVGLVDDSGSIRIPFSVEEGSTLRFDSGKYGFHIYNKGSLTFNGGTFADLSLSSAKGNVVVNGGSFITEATQSDSNTPEGTFRLTNSADSTMNIKGGEFNLEYHKYSINNDPSLIQNNGTLNISGGTFRYDFTNTFGVGSTDRPYYGDPGALIRNTGKTEISGGVFNGKGTLVNQLGSSEASTKITGGTFEVESVFTSLKSIDEESPTTLEVTGGTFNTRKTFYLADYKDKLPTSQMSSESGGYAYGLWTDGTNVRAGMATGPSENHPYYIGKVSENGIKGGDFSDGTHVEPAPGYSTIDLDTDFDNDGVKDVRVLKNADVLPKNVSVGVGEQIALDLGIPEKGAWRIYSIENNDRCSATISNGQIVFTGIKPTNGQNCKVTVVSDAKIWKFDVTVATKGFNGGVINTTNPIEMEVGDTKKPEDLPEGAEGGEWSSDNTEICTVAEDGTITAKKAGTCHVTLKLDDGSEYIWEVNIKAGADDTKANPDTADNMKAITFSIAGAAIAGFGAMVAVARRFIRR